MKDNIHDWLRELKSAKIKKAMPILSFPCVQLLGITVKDLISDSDKQAKGMKLIAEKVDSSATVSFMDLSLEAECFGSEIRVSDDEVPTVIGNIVSDMESAKALKVPPVGSGRTQFYLEAARKVVQMINDRPVFGGIIGPFSLTGRLVGVSEAMIYCYEETEMMHEVLSKTTEFLISYAKEYKKTGVNGILMAEPLTGLLSPDLAREFSQPYVKKINDAVRDENFIVIYHNCGNATIHMIDSILECGADAYHFGNTIDMSEMMKHIPEDTIAMGNIAPAGQFRNGTPESIREATLELMSKCCKYPNFVVSSGCDIPPLSSWENIEAFFAAVKEFYSE
ncbi:MAG: uroporphyrinogen decarboxylase family protein [Treponema sp.]|nr:uroporphyrinogen decarboxylase family protein [Treponema sp.]